MPSPPSPPLKNFTVPPYCEPKGIIKAVKPAFSIQSEL